MDGCVYERDGLEYCFISKPVAESADVVCEDGTTGSAGPTTTQSLSAAAAQAKDDKQTISWQWPFQAPESDQRSPWFKCPGCIKQQYCYFQPPPILCEPPVQCTSLLKLMDDITNTLADKPADVRPLIDALKAIKKPLDEPCSADDISQLETKRDTAKSTATAAVVKQTNLKSAATEKYNTANDKLKSLNQQLAEQGGQTIPAGTAAPPVATMPTLPGADGAAGADGAETTAAAKGKCFRKVGGTS